MVRGCRTHASEDDSLVTEDDGLVTEEESMLHRQSKPSPVILAELDNVDSGTEDLLNVPVNEDGGYFDAIGWASLKLVSREHSSEIQWHGLKLVLHLLRYRWKDDSIGFSDSLDIPGLSENWSDYAIKLTSKKSAAAFVAEIACRNGVSLLKILVPYLSSLSTEGACEAKLVCLILKFMLSFGSTCATHIKGGKSDGLDEFLPQILPLLSSLLDKHSQAAFVEQSNQHMELANQHESTVIAVLDTALDYLTWTPFCDLAMDIVRRCGSLLYCRKFGIHALQFLKRIWQRKRCVELDVAVDLIFPILMNVPENYLKCTEPELHCLKAMWPSMGYRTDLYARGVDKYFEFLAPVIESCQDPSKPHIERLLTYSAPLPQILDEISCPSVSEDASEEKGYLTEGHIILSEAFIFVASCPWIENYTELLLYTLHPLSIIWTQLEVYHFCNYQFRLSVHNVTAFIREEFGICEKGQSNCSNQKSLIPHVLSLLLKMLRCVHSLWMEELEEVVDLFCIMKGTTAEEILLGDIRQCLLDIHRTGYKVICLCAAYHDATFDEFLDSTIFCDILREDIESMDFQHVTWLVINVIIPLVQKCPSKLWTKWIDSLLQPLFHYCDYKLYASWCKILYNDTSHVSKNLDDSCISSEEDKKLSMDLFKLTREVSNLLAAVALPELNAGMTNESSLVRYLLYHDGLNHSVRRLIRNILGYWTDDEAKMKAVPFCLCLVSRSCSVAENSNLVSCIKDDIIPSIIRCLALKSSSNNNAKLSSDVDLVLARLCEEAYNCIQNKGLAGEESDDEDKTETFKSWFLKQITVTQYQNSSIDKLEDFVWIWEIEEEFTDYLPTYTDMLYAVNKFGDAMEDGYFPSDSPDLMAEFMSNTEIDCSADSVQWTISSMLSRKLSSVYWKRQNKQMFKFYCKIINSKPYNKYTGFDENMQGLIKNTSEEWSLLPQFHRSSGAEFFCRILELLEPQFHPLIREDHRDVLTEIARQLTSGEYTSYLQPFQPVSTDFLGHLQPYAQRYIDEKREQAGYYRAKQQAELHKLFDTCLASGEFDHYIRQHDFPMSIRKDKGFLDLDSDLLKLSLERRTKLLNEQDHLCSYFQQMKDLLVNEQLRDAAQSLITELESEGFFRLNDDSIDWGKKQFSELVEKFEQCVFPALSLPKHYVIRGIMDFRQIIHMEDDLGDAFAVVVGGPYNRWMDNLHLLWMDTRYYMHDYYDTIQNPLKKVWKKQD